MLNNLSVLADEEERLVITEVYKEVRTHFENILCTIEGFNNRNVKWSVEIGEYDIDVHHSIEQYLADPEDLEFFANAKTVIYEIDQIKERLDEIEQYAIEAKEIMEEELEDDLNYEVYQYGQGYALWYERDTIPSRNLAMEFHDYMTSADIVQILLSSLK